MNRCLQGLVIAASVAFGVSSAQAQGLPKSYSYVLAQPTELKGMTNVPSVASGAVIPRPTFGTTYIPPYSYQVVANPYATRYYSGYGTNDFPFYGQPYGRPYDAWTWNYLSHGYYNGMAHFYYEPLPPSVAPGFAIKAKTPTRPAATR